MLKERDFSPDRYQFAKALAHTLDTYDKEELSRHAELDILRQEKATEARQRLEEVIDHSTFPPATLAFDELREKLMALVPDNAGVTPEQFAEDVLGDRQMFIRGARDRLAATSGTLGKENIATILESIRDAAELDESKYGASSVAWFRQRLAKGQLRSLLDSEDWNRSLLKAHEPNEVRLIVDSIPQWIISELTPEAHTRIRDSLTPSLEADARTWTDWGSDLHLKLGWLVESEAAYRKAIELDPKFAVPWNKLGNLFSWSLGRHAEAKAAYQKAIELDPRFAYPWNNLGNLLRNHFGRYEEAEEAYHKAIELDTQDPQPWDNLGDLLQDHLGRYSEAESAYRKAVEIDQKYAPAWNGLGLLFHYVLGRYKEAEEAYRKAIELDSQDPYPWRNLGELLRDHLSRYAEAEAAYRRAVEIDPQKSGAWNGLGNLYCDHCQKYSDAASAFTKALQCGDGEAARQNLVFLYRDFVVDTPAAKQTFALLRADPHCTFNDSFHLQEALFAAYDSNWGLCREALAKAIKAIGEQFPSSTIDDWCRASAVLLHLNFGEELLAFLRERGDDARLRPWYEALSALHRSDRRYLQNIPVEMRATAEFYFDQIEKRLNALPDKTRRRPAPKPAKKRRKV